MSSLIGEIVAAADNLDMRRGERGMVEGRRTSTPISQRSIVDLDALDAQNELRKVLRKWADHVISARSLSRSFQWVRPPDLLRGHWDWAMKQTWGPAMVADLESLRDRLANGGRTVRLVACPVCRLPVRADTFVADHRECITTSLAETDEDV